MAATFLFIDFVRSQQQQTKEQINGYRIRWFRVRNSSFSLCFCGTKGFEKNGCNFFIHRFCSLATSANERTNQGLSNKVVPSAKFVFFVMFLWNKRFGQNGCNFFIHRFCSLLTSANERTNQGLSNKVVPSTKFVFFVMFLWNKRFGQNGCNFFIHRFCSLATSANERTNQGLSIKVVPSAKFVFFVMLLWNKRFGQKWLQLFYSSLLFARNISKRKNKSRAIDKGGSECEIRLFRYVTVEQKVWTKMAATFLFIDFVRS